MRNRFLQGTRVERTDSAQALAEGFSLLRRRGRRAIAVRRIGCAVMVPAVVLGVLAMVVPGYVWWVGGIGLVALACARLATYGDPELADDERVEFLVTLFEQWNGEEPITIAADLNAPDMTAPDDRERIGGGVIRCRYSQSWLLLTVPSGASVQLTHERTQVEDGVEARDIEDRHLVEYGDGNHVQSRTALDPLLVRAALEPRPARGPKST